MGAGSARERLGASVTAALAGMEGVSVFDAPPVRAAVPYLVVGEAEVRTFDAAGLTGRQVRIVVEMIDAGERPVRLRALQDAAEARVLNLARELGGGWRLATLSLARSRVVRAGDARWRGASEFTGVMYRADS